MEKLVSYPISVVYYLCFGLTLVIFHPIQWFCLNVFGYQAHKKSVDYLNFCLTKCTNILGTTYSVKNKEVIPNNVPIIFVANHQSLYDIIGIIWFLRRFHAKFVSKKELGKGIPSVSYNLRHGGSVLIDRKDPKQALPVIKGLGEYIEKHNRSAVIFPEGTRSKTGKPKEFAQSGLKILCKYAPNAYIVPISINNSWKMVKFGVFPMGLGNKLEFIIHQPMAVKDYSFEEIMQKTESAVVSAIKI
ncbi:MAG: lysophospholipid acyltransferase family protein [Flavobacterium sp.]|jgi:1-acyl-sn-glycerol-3-phosphate acyltransferase|uniref:lysophospholipid acyltransferase family protein n=1 Tax=Flavobacterium TaxID=237 RepID=UPI0022CC111D|nr:lysophospholipid acyltransferase family protein [Flavobacterium sp.]MCZ8089730.1 lysophospholipid acyltransferase family protein [Flavobacterium sp.]MCZ8329735.1 lysophospholipid acyltransferase family protein [Flavobacterium sp.]